MGNLRQSMTKEEWSALEKPLYNIENKEIMFKEKLEKFKLPLQPDEVEWKVGSERSPKGYYKVLAYIDNRAVMTRLDGCFGAENWRSHFVPISSAEYGFLCTLSIYDGTKWLSKQDGASQTTNFEPIKGGISDAMKRAAHQWGLGRELYSYPTIYIKESAENVYPQMGLYRNKLENITQRYLEGAIKSSDTEFIEANDRPGMTKVDLNTLEELFRYKVGLGLSPQAVINNLKDRYDIATEQYHYLAKIGTELVNG